MGVEFAGEFLEDRVGAVGGFGVAGLHAPAQRGEAVVQPDGEVQRILVAAVLRLVERFLDPGEIGDQFPAVGEQAAIVRAFEPLLQLAAHLADADDRLVRRRSAIADAAGQLELLHQVGGGHALQPGIGDQGERRAPADPGGFHGDRVLTGRRLGAARRPGAPEDHPLELRGAPVSAVPDEPVQPLGGRRCRRTPRPEPGEVRLRFPLRFGPLETIHQLPGSVVDLDDYRLHFGGEVVLDHRVLDAAHRPAGLEHGQRGVRGVGLHLPQRLDVVEDPETAAVRPQDDIAVLHHQVADRRIRQVLLQSRPAIAVVQRHIDAVLGAEEQEPLPHRVFADRAGEVSGSDSLDDLRPGGAVVGRAEDIRLPVVHLVAVRGQERGSRSVRRLFQDAHPAELRQVRRRDLRPGPAVIPGQMHPAVVGGDPDGVEVVLRGSDREDRGVDLRPVHVHGDEAAGLAERLRVGVGEVGADLRPGLAIVGGEVEELRTRVEPVLVERREHDGESPLPAVRQRARRFAGEEPRIDLDVADLAVRPVVPGQQRALAAGVEHIEVRRMLRDVSALAPAGRVVPAAPRPPRLHVVPALAGNAHRGVVLLRSAHMVGKVVGDIHMVQLGGHIRLAGPGLAAVHRDIAAAVVRVAHPLWIVGIDPEVVLVSVRRTDHMVEGFAAVVGAVEAGIERVHPVRIHRVGVHPGVVEGALAEFPLVVREPPGGAPVVGAEHAAFGRFHDGPHPIRIRRGNGDPDLADGPFRHSRVLRQLDPGVAAVVGAVEPGIRSAAPHLPGLAVHLPDGRVEHFGVPPVDDQVGGAGAGAHEEDPFPGVPPVGGAEHAALFVVAVGMAERGHIDQVRVHRVDADAGDRLGVGEAHMPPGLAAVAAPVHPVALGDAAAQLRLPAADEHDVRVRLGHGDGADGGTGDLPVGHREPGGPGIQGLPEPAAGGAEVVLVLPAGAAGATQGATAARRADVAPLQRPEEGLVEVEVLAGGGAGQRDQGEQGERDREGAAERGRRTGHRDSLLAGKRLRAPGGIGAIGGRGAYETPPLPVRSAARPALAIASPKTGRGSSGGTRGRPAGRQYLRSGGIFRRPAPTRTGSPIGLLRGVASIFGSDGQPIPADLPQAAQGEGTRRQAEGQGTPAPRTSDREGVRGSAPDPHRSGHRRPRSRPPGTGVEDGRCPD